MKKRVWGIPLTLMLCTAALCVGASAEETSSNGYPDWTWHFKSLDDVQCLMAVRWNSGT